MLYTKDQGTFPYFVIPPQPRAVEIKPTFLNLVSAHLLSGKDHEDPYVHLDTFY